MDSATPMVAAASGGDDGDDLDIILWDIIDGATAADDGGNDGSNGGDIILWDIVDSVTGGSDGSDGGVWDIVG